MHAKLTQLILVAFVLTVWLSGSTAFGARNDFNRVPLGQEPVEITDRDLRAARQSLAGNEANGEITLSGSRAESPGMVVGWTTSDLQSIHGMTRQVEWRGEEYVHFAWARQLDSLEYGSCATIYEVWDPFVGTFLYSNGSYSTGCLVHPDLGYLNEFSRGTGVDAAGDGRAVIAAHHAVDNDFDITVWYDFLPALCFFSVYEHRINDDEENVWPVHVYQFSSTDTVTHIVAKNLLTGDPAENYVTYFRRIGGPEAGSWDPPMIVDTIENFSHTVAASRFSGKAAIVWAGHLPATPGGSESQTYGAEGDNDIYYMISENLGLTWGAKQNLTQSDPAIAGWRAFPDVSCLIDTANILHIVWPAREYSTDGGGTFPHFYGSRLFHWSDYHDQITVIKDANWDLPTGHHCHGGDYNEVSIVKPTISQCMNKYYTIFTQFNDIDGGIDDDCHISYLGGDYSGTANGELYLAVSDDLGLTWDIARNLTNSYTPSCDTGAFDPNCESDIFASMPKFGMKKGTLDFTGVPIVDPSGGAYTGDFYLDVFYVNDRHPGLCLYDAGVWTINPMKWFRIPCVDPNVQRIIKITPPGFDWPTRTMPSVQKDTSIIIENLGNDELEVYSIATVETNGPSGWLAVGDSGPFVIPHTPPGNFHELDVYLNHNGVIASGPITVEGYIVIASNADSRAEDTVFVRLTVADDIVEPEVSYISTGATRLTINSAGNVGQGGNPPEGGYNMNLIDPPDCDTTFNLDGYNDNASVYLSEGSPIVARYDEGTGKTLINYYGYSDDWTTPNGFLPLGGFKADNVPMPGYNFTETDTFITTDSTIGLVCKYIGPTGGDTAHSIIQRLCVFNRTGGLLEDVCLGVFNDWDIPSDSGVENGTGFDSFHKMMYCFGAEYGPDQYPNDDCVPADDRMGALAYYWGEQFCNVVLDTFSSPKAMWTENNATYVYPNDGFDPNEIYDLMSTMVSYSNWFSPDSDYADLHMVCDLGEFDISPDDTLYFTLIMAAVYGNRQSIEETVDQAKAWLGNHPDIWDIDITCCDLPGDADNDGIVNILDITFLISYLYKGGPAPPCLVEGDANGDCILNILDITYLISYLYKGGPAPICNECPETR